MQPYSSVHKLAVVISIIAIIFLTYAVILVSSFKTPEATSDFFKNSNTYYYIAEIVKADIRNRYSPALRTNVIQLAAADQLLNIIVSPNVIERLSLPILRARARIAKLPLSFAENNLVIDTKKYTDQLSSTLSSFNLPPTITDAGNKVIASIPSQITVVDTAKNPNSILVAITKTRMFFENLQTIIRIVGIILTIAVVALIVINLRLLKRLTKGLLWIFAVCGVVILLLSFIAPWIASIASNNPDPVAGVLKDDLVKNMVSYYVSLTRTTSLIYIGIAIALSLMYRFLPYPKIQQWENDHMLPHSSTTHKPKATSAKQPRRKSPKA